jgi:hypothetical protein
MKYEPGMKVVIRHNPHHPAAEDILGTVVEYRPGAGFARCDLVDVAYENPQDGEVRVMPFGKANLSQGDPATLTALAARYDALAAELRRLARG